MSKYAEPVPRGQMIGVFVTLGVAFVALLIALEVGAIERLGEWWRGEGGAAEAPGDHGGAEAFTPHPTRSGEEIRGALAEYMDADAQVSISSTGPNGTTLRVTSTLCTEREFFDGILDEVRASGADEELRAAGFIRIECHGGDFVEHSAAP